MWLERALRPFFLGSYRAGSYLIRGFGPRAAAAIRHDMHMACNVNMFWFGHFASCGFGVSLRCPPSLQGIALQNIALWLRKLVEYCGSLWNIAVACGMLR